MVSTTREENPASEAQLRFADRLGLKVEAGATRRGISILISREVKRRGKQALKDFQPFVYQLVKHPKYGDCEIVRIGEQTLKITLATEGGTGSKKVIDAMFLAECIKLED